MAKVVRALLLVAAAIGTGAAQVPASRSTPLFDVTSDDFWLNLHHYLYVIGRARTGAADARQPAVASAPADEDQGRAVLTDAERRIWDDAVTAYANGLSRRTSFLEPALASTTLALGGTGAAETFPSSTVDPGTRASLERAAPVYRKAWWPRHRAMNEQYQRTLRQMVDRDGPAMLAFLTRAYRIEWPARPYPVHLVAYLNFAGAFSITNGAIVMSTNSYPANEGWYPLESAFHEALHQWDDEVARLLRAEAMARGVSVPVDLSHTLIFFTAGEAVRRLHPEHVPMIDALNLWQVRLSGARVPPQRLQAALLEIWRPYLDGRGMRDEAFGQLLEAAAR